MKGIYKRRALPRPRIVWAIAALAVALAAAAGNAVAAPPPLQPIDPQNWIDPSAMTWADYTPVPGPDWSDPSLVPSIKKWRAAIILVDYADMPFTVTQPQGSDKFGNPQATGHDIPRESVPAFWQSYLNTPQIANHFQTMNKYWMEDTYGKYGVQLDTFGPYRMPKKSWDYHVVESITGGTGASCPVQTNVTGAQTNVTNIAVANSAPFSVTQPINVGTSARTITAIPDSTHITVNTNTSPANNALVHSCVGNIRTDARAAWVAATSSTTPALYDNVFYVGAGQDESGTWQEFGPMMWLNKEDVTPLYGPPTGPQYAALPNWMITRFAPWSSWAVGETLWPNASGNTSVEAESSGMGTFAHEFTHNLGIGDNYNNPYGNPPQRPATGYWDMMSRGSFNGPGGTHTRYLIPGQNGSALGSDHNVRNKLKLGFLTNSNAVRLNRNGLATTGMVVTTLKARAADPGPTGLSALSIVLDGTAPVDKDPACNTAVDFTCANPTFTGYTMEAVQRIGNDSFGTGHGVLISKTKTSESSSCGTFTCFVWVIDAHPENINLVDFYRPDGTPENISMAHPRQLNDATFNAGLGSGSQYEYEDTPNRLHFYVLDKITGPDGVISYKVGVKSLDGAGPQTRGVSVTAAPAHPDLLGQSTTCAFPLTNTGAAAATSTTAHPQGDVSAFVNNDVYRLSVSSTGSGWNAQLWNALSSAGFGETTSVPVYVTRDAGSAPSSTVTLTATSVSDPSKTASATCELAVPKPTVTFTLSPASPNGGGGWYTTDVGLTWTVTDADSTSGCGPVTVTAEGVNQITCSATNDGGTTSVTATVKIDKTAPVTTATLTPGIRNGWYASPTLSFTIADGVGSGGDHTEYKVDGEASWHTGSSVSGFSTGNHFVQYRSTDIAGWTEAVKLIAFKVDAVAPSVNIVTPDAGESIPLDKVVKAKFKCDDNESGMDTCVGTVANGAAIATNTVGPHSFTVTGTDKAGNVTAVTHNYLVVYTWQGFFSPITNTESAKLNLAHAGDLLKLGFSLNGDRGLNVFAGPPTATEISCPSWPVHNVPAGGAGTTAGLSFGVASGHYTYGWQTDAGWAGKCVRFSFTLNDGSGTAHSADFMFFA